MTNTATASTIFILSGENMKKFRIGIWDHCRYATNRQAPYDEMARHLERMAACGVTLTNIYLPEVISLDDYCRAAANCGMELEARITPAWASEKVVTRTLPESEWQRMEKDLGIRLSGPCGNREDNREFFLAAAEKLAAEYGSRLNALHLDFIRNDTALTLLDFPCQCQVCKDLYKRFFGVETLTAEMRKNPAVLYKLAALRCKNIRKTAEAMKRIAEKHGLRLSIAARANYVNSADITVPPVWGLGPAVIEGQDWVEWADEGIIDELFPMNYHTEIGLFESVLKDHKRLLGDKAVKMLFPGVGVESSMGINSPEEVARRLEIVKNNDLPGVMLFNKTNIYSDDHCRVIREYAAE